MSCVIKFKQIKDNRCLFLFYYRNQTIILFRKEKLIVMSLSQSKLMIQLAKQQRTNNKSLFSEEKLQDLYITTGKNQPKNLLLIEFLTLAIEKNLIKNSNKIKWFMDMFQQVKGKKLEQEQGSFTKGEKQQQKFNKKKFLKLLKDIAKKLYPGDPKAYETTLFQKLISHDSEQNRMKVDQNLKKYLCEDVINCLDVYEKELQTLFQVFMPQNYNSKLEFNWNEIRLLQKKLPLICVLRILFQAQICPQFVTPLQFLDIISKLIPPMNSNHKEIMFYYSQTFNNYMREHIFHQEIKLLQGDIGVTFLEFQMLMSRIATQYCKQNKTDFVKYIQKFMNQLSITQIIKTKKEPTTKLTKLQKTIFRYIKDKQKTDNVNKTSVKKEAFQKKEITDLIDNAEAARLNEEAYKLQFKNLTVTQADIMKIKRNLDDELGPIPQKKVVDKENQGYFDVQKKYVVIGQQLPKLQQKNKPAVKLNPKQKKQDQFLGFKPQKEVQIEKLNPIVNRKKKLRINTQYPIILSEVFYPSHLTEELRLKQKQEIYLQTTYIHLGQRLYEEAYVNYLKAKNEGFVDRKNFVNLFYFQVLAAQIFEAAGKDEVALYHFSQAKQISYNLPATEVKSKAFAYMGLASSLYHLEEYQFSLRCLLKAKQIYGQNLLLESLQNAILLNNIGSCFMMLNRNQEAIKQFNISHQILDLLVGRFDQKSLVVQQNIAKNRKAYIQMMPSFKTMWKTYVQKSNAVVPVKKAKK